MKKNWQHPATVFFSAHDETNVTLFFSFCPFWSQFINMSVSLLIPMEQQKNQKELDRISQVVPAFDSSELLRLLCDKEDFEEDHAKKAISELFRFLALKVLYLDLNATKLSPSGVVDKIWHCFLLFPKPYSQFCNMILPSEVEAPRIIGHNPFGAEDGNRENRYMRTLVRYERVFGIEPPSLFWEDPEDEEDEEDEDDKEESGEKADDIAGGENIRKRFRLNESGESNCGKFTCNCDPSQGSTAPVEGVTSQIFVKNLVGGTQTYNVDLRNATVNQLKAQIHIREGVPFEKYGLVFAGKHLDDGRTLSSYNILKESTFHLVLKLRGC